MIPPQHATDLPWVLAPLKIEIGGVGSRPYKSIDDLTWDNIPSFAVLTGLNGSGKTQLLELLAHVMTKTMHPQHGDLAQTKVTISGDSFGPDDVAYLPNSGAFSSVGSLALAQMQQAKQQLHSQISDRRNPRDMSLNIKRARLERYFGGKDIGQVSQEVFVRDLPDDFAFMLEDTNVVAGLSHVFLAYRLRFLENLEKRIPEAETRTKLGPAPWDVVNEVFQTAQFPYRVISPMGSSFLDAYQLALVDQQTRESRNPNDLSSGEKVLLQLVLWLYNSKHHNRFPRLFLFDEPDAHLHPSMTRQFMDVIKEVLVDRYRVRVILTTHSPSTVALAPEDSVFEMSRTKPRICPSKSKADTIGLLTAGLVIVSRTTRYVLVEDEADAEFYGALRDILSDYGPSRDPRALRPSPSLVFLAASLGEGKNKVGGGKSIVTQWVDKFDEPPLDQFFRGVIDLDGGNTPTPRVHVLGRYSIENYLPDPFVVFGVMLDDGKSQKIAGIKISQGDEHLIRLLSEKKLQIIVDFIRQNIEPNLPGLTALEQIPYLVSFTNGKTVQYPTWMIQHRGHDLLPIFQAAFGDPKVISQPRLRKSLHRVRLIANELAEIMNQLQG